MPTKKNKILVYDFGDYTEHAIALGRKGHNVLYYCNWETAFPNSNKMLIGQGMEYITKVMDFWKYVDEVDIIVFFGNNNGDLIEYLRKKGYKVFGTGQAEKLELDRWFLHNALKKVGLPTNELVKIIGITNLIEHLKSLENKYIKTSWIRGDMETHHFEDYESSQPWLDDLAIKLGSRKEEVEFIVEDPIDDAVESGYDGFCIDGKYPKTTLMGYEYKDKGYIGKIVDYDELHKSIKKVNESFSPYFKNTKFRNLFSTEIRINKEGIGYLIDPCMRAGIPPSEIMIEIYENFDEIVIKGAEGILIEPKPIAKYGAEIFFNSEWAEDDKWLKISIPEEIRQWVKIIGACKLNGEYYIIPKAMGKYMGACSVVAIGDSLKECFSLIKKRIKMVEAFQLEKDVNTSYLEEYIKKGNRLGIKL